MPSASPPRLTRGWIPRVPERLVNFLNGQTGPASPLAQGIPHVLIDGRASLHTGPQNPAAAALEADLRRTVRGEFHFDGATRGLYASDASNYRQGNV